MYCWKTSRRSIFSRSSNASSPSNLGATLRQVLVTCSSPALAREQDDLKPEPLTPYLGVALRQVLVTCSSPALAREQDDLKPEPLTPNLGVALRQMLVTCSSPALV